MKKSRIQVTDHAVVRYLERVHGVDIEGLRRRIGRIADLAAEETVPCRVLSDGMAYQISGGRVVTVICAQG